MAITAPDPNYVLVLGRVYGVLLANDPAYSNRVHMLRISSAPV